MELKAFLEEINSVYSYDFRHYSAGSIRRRISHCMNIMNFKTIGELQEKVLGDAKVFLELMQYITVPVSSMFRDASYFLSVREKVIPYLRTYPSIKVWVAGCSSGEEVYSLAIILKEEGLLERTTIYATDINAKTLARAEQGLFKLEEIEKTNSEYKLAGGTKKLSDYYTVSRNQIEFDPVLRKNIVFSNHSLATDSVFAETQFISCRNVLIYFDAFLQNKVFDLFHESLCHKGFLGLGSKENLQFSKHEGTFSSFVKSDQIYQKK